MNAPNNGKPLPKPADNLDSSNAQSIDALYGLEPVLEPGLSGEEGAAQGGMQFQLIECPYCGETFETAVDLSSGSASYVEDCQVCCRPIEFQLEVDHAGTLQSLSALRSD